MTKARRLGNRVEMTRRVDEAQNCIFAMAIDGNGATIRPVRRGRQPVRLHALGERDLSECARRARHRQLARQGEQGRRSAPRRPPIGALAAKIFGGAQSHDRFTGPRKSLHPNHAIDRGVADHMDHLPLSAANQPLQCLTPEFCRIPTTRRTLYVSNASRCPTSTRACVPCRMSRRRGAFCRT